MIGYAKKIEKIIRESAFDKKKKKPGLKFNPGLALTGVRTTGPWSISFLNYPPPPPTTALDFAFTNTAKEISFVFINHFNIVKIIMNNC